MLLFLGAGSVMDIRKKEISGVFLIGFLLLGAAVQLGKMAVSYGEEPWQGWIAGAFAGALLLGLARLSGQALGYGDALAAMILGVWLGLLPLAEIFFWAVPVSGVWGVAVSGKEKRRKAQDGVSSLSDGRLCDLAAHGRGGGSMRFQGSYTVEAALLMAVLIPLLAGVLYLGFYMHDKAFMKSAAYEAAILENMDGKREPGKINDGLLGIRGAGLEVSGDNRRVSAEASGTFLIPGFVAEFFAAGSCSCRLLRSRG